MRLTLQVENTAGTPTGSTFAGRVARLDEAKAAAMMQDFDHTATHVLTTALNTDLVEGRFVADTAGDRRWRLQRRIDLPAGFIAQSRWYLAEELRGAT